MRMKERTSRKPDLLSSLEAKLQTIGTLDLPLLSGRCCIYRVPPKLRKVNEEAYTPTVVSIGPYHHGDKRLEAMEEAKLWFLNKFLKRTQGKLLGEYVKALRGWEVEIRRCYSETIPMESDDFVSMILTDACFIIEYFLTTAGPPEEDPWHSKQWPKIDIRQDLILLENQLPYLVLKRLFELTFPPSFNNRYSFVKFTFESIRRRFLIHIVSNEKHHDKFSFEYFEQHHLPKLVDGTEQVEHLCDMLRLFYVRHDPPRIRKECIRMNPLNSASKLHDAGIVLQAADQDGISLIEAQYSKGLLKIPKIMFFDSTETILRNIVAFEQRHLPFMHHVTDYVILMDDLINTEKDVEILVEKEIIENWLGENNAVASLVNRLCKDITVTSFNCDYISLSKDLNDFYDQPYHKYKAIFKHEYLSTPWKIASLLAAILLLLLTFIQTICCIIKK